MVEKETKQQEVKIVQVPTEFGMAYQIGEEEPISQADLLVKIFNDIQAIKRSLL